MKERKNDRNEKMRERKNERGKMKERKNDRNEKMKEIKKDRKKDNYQNKKRKKIRWKERKMKERKNERKTITRIRKGLCQVSESAFARAVTTTNRARMSPSEPKILFRRSNLCPNATFKITNMAFGTLLAILKKTTFWNVSLM